MRGNRVAKGIFKEKNGTFTVVYYVGSKQQPASKGHLKLKTAKAAKKRLEADAVSAKNGIIPQRYLTMTINEGIEHLILQEKLYRIAHSKGSKISFNQTDSANDNPSFTAFTETITDKETKTTLGETKISKIDFKAVDGFVSARRKAVKDSTIKTNYSVLCRIYDLFRGQNITDIKIKKLGDIKWLNQPQGRADSRKCVPQVILDCLLKEIINRMIDDPKYYLFIHAAATGQRPKEISDLLLSDLHLEDNHIEVRHEAQKSKTWKTQLKNRWVDMPPWLIPHLLHYIEVVKPDTKGPLFPARILPPKSPKWYSHDFSIMFNKLQKENGWKERYTLYCFRYTVATDLVKAAIAEGVDLSAVAEQLGHSVKILIKTYLDNSGKRLFGLGMRQEKVVQLKKKTPINKVKPTVLIEEKAEVAV